MPLSFRRFDACRAALAGLAAFVLWISHGTLNADDTKPAEGAKTQAAVKSGAEAAPARNGVEGAVPDALHRYIGRPEPDYRWSLEDTLTVADSKVHRLKLVSQNWQGLIWEHVLMVYEPPKLENPRHMLLFVTGGKNGTIPGVNDMTLGVKLAALCGARVAILHQVPNQPLFDGRVEDDLITETWLRFLETGDETWPLLFPMVKSAVKAMDALEEFAKEQKFEKVEGFVITGASKRGWTSWLTPVADRRVIATAPIVINVLNFRPQMKHQIDIWGKYSEQIDDYTRKGLIKIVENSENERETRLRTMMDPWTYRNLLRLPKLIIVGTNDRYWTCDAMNFYYDDLVGPKYVLQCPNVGHNLGDRKEFALTTLGVYFRHQATGRPMPELTWKYSNGGNEVKLTVTSNVKPREARLWTAASDSKDFRGSKWTSQPIEFDGDTATVITEKPQGKTARFIEVEYETDGIPYSLTTQLYRD